MKTRVQYIILALALLGIIALLYPAQTTNPQNRLKAEIETNLRTITLATLSMALETDGKLPADWTHVLAAFFIHQCGQSLRYTSQLGPNRPRRQGDGMD